MLGRHPHQPMVRLLQNALVVIEPGEQPIAALPGCQLMRMSQFTGLLCKLLQVDLRARGVSDDGVSDDGGRDGNCPAASSSWHGDFPDRNGRWGCRAVMVIMGEISSPIGTPSIGGAHQSPK